MQPPHLAEDDVRQRTWIELGRAVHDRHHEWRTPVLATVGKDGLPNARTVVLRQADSTLQQLQFYTDRRSPKVSDLTHHPHAVLAFWSKRLNWQLRVRVNVVVHTAGPEVDAVWKRVSQSAAAGDYLSASAPGDALASAQAASSEQTHVHHLAIVCAQVRDIDWLELSRSGHRRAVFSLNSWEWRVP